MSISIKALGTAFIASATLLTPAYNTSIRADDKQTTAFEDTSSNPSHPDYIKGKDLKKEAKKAFDNPNDVFAQQFFSNPALVLSNETIKSVVTDKYVDTLLAKTVAERPDFPATEEHLKIMTDQPDTTFSKGLENNLSGRINIGKVIEATDITFKERLARAPKDKFVLVDFWAPWCGPCRQLAPIVEEIANKYGEKLIVLKVNIDWNTDTNPKTRNEYPIINEGIPVLMLLQDSKPKVQNITDPAWENLQNKLKEQKNKKLNSEEFQKLYKEEIFNQVEKSLTDN